MKFQFKPRSVSDRKAASYDLTLCSLFSVLRKQDPKAQYSHMPEKSRERDPLLQKHPD